MRAGKYFRNNCLLFSPRLEIAVAIGKAHYRVCVSHIDPFRICTWRVESYPEGLSKSGHKGVSLLGFAVFGNPAKDSDFSLIALGKEDVAIGRSAQLAWFIEPGGK